MKRIERRAAAGRLRERPADAAFRRWRHDAGNRRAVRGPARRLRHRRRRDCEPPHRHALRLRELHRPRHGRHQLRRPRWSSAANPASPRTGTSSSAIPSASPASRLLTIGAGGGSLAWIDDAGSLHNGPQSAGADPGPACYGRGNTTPTNTDANLALGRLGTQLAGGQIVLDKAASETAVRTGVAEPLGMDPTAAAKAIVSVANANMADAVRLISISRGYDPRDFALVAFGGAGALHGVALAKELSIPTVIVPPNPGRDVGARLPARGRAPRPLADLSRARGRGRSGRYRGPLRRDGGGGEEPAGEGRRGGRPTWCCNAPST